MTNNNNSTAAMTTAILAMGPGPFYLLTLWMVRVNGLPQTVAQLANNVVHGTMTNPTIRTNLAKLNGLQLVAKTQPMGTYVTTQTAKTIWDQSGQEKNFFLTNTINDSSINNPNNLIINNTEKKFFQTTNDILAWTGVMDPTRSTLTHLDPVMVLAVTIQTIKDTIENPKMTFRPGLLIHNLRQANPKHFDFKINPARLSHDQQCICDSCHNWRMDSNMSADAAKKFIKSNKLESILDPPGQFDHLINRE